MADYEKPGAAPSAPLTGGMGDSGAPTFYLRAKEADLDVHTRAMDGTRIGDAAPQVETNGYLYGNFRVRGAMVPRQAAGLEKIAGRNAAVNVVLLLGGTRKICPSVKVIAAKIRWQERAEYTGVAFVARTHNIDPANLEQAIT